MSKELNKAFLLKTAKKIGTPVYLYDGNKIKKQCKNLKKNLKNMVLYYACKANTNPQIVKLIYEQGFSIETVSFGEITIARNAGAPVSKISFTCGGIDEKELISIAKQEIRMRLDSLHQVDMFGKNFKGKEISVRLNLHIGAGHHSHVITGGPDSKFGIDISNIEELKTLAKKYNLRITGIHHHIGSNILEVDTLIKAMKVILKTALLFPDLKYIDFGGGFGVPYKKEQKELDIKTFGKKAKILISDFIKKYGKKVEVSFEPGRYLVAESGYLLVKVNDIKNNPTKTFISVNSGFNHLIRPAMYDSYHEIENLSSKENKLEKVTIAGNICESGDIFAKDRMFIKTKIGDILAIKNAGAYGYAMSSNYNSRPKPKEFLISGKKIQQI